MQGVICVKTENSVGAWISGRKEHKIEKGCSHNALADTIEKLAAAGSFHPRKASCKLCGKKFPGKCMGMYKTMDFYDRFSIEAIIESVVVEVNHRIYDCPHRIPAKL